MQMTSPILLPTPVLVKGMSKSLVNSIEQSLNVQVYTYRKQLSILQKKQLQLQHFFSVLFHLHPDEVKVAFDKDGGLNMVKHWYVPNKYPVFCLFVSKHEYSVHKSLFHAMVRKHRNTFCPTIIVLDTVMKELRVMDHFIEIQSMSALTTAVNLAFVDWQDQKDALRKTKGQSAQNHADGTSRRRVIRGESRVASTPRHPSRSKSHSAIPIQSGRTNCVAASNRSKTLPSKGNHQKQQELDLLDLTDPSAPQSVQHFFSDSSNHGSTIQAKSNQRSTSSNSLSKRHSDLQVQSNLNANTSSRAKSQAPPSQHAQHTNARSKSGIDLDEIFSSSDISNMPSPMNQSKSTGNLQCTGLHSPLTPDRSSSSLSESISPIERSPRQVNYPRRSDVELIKSIHKKRGSVNSANQNGKPVVGTTQFNDRPTSKSPPRLQPETFELNEVALLDFDFDTTEDEHEHLPSTSSLDELTQELDDMMERMGIQETSSEKPSTPIKSGNESPDTSKQQKVGRMLLEVFDEEERFVKALESLEATFLDPLKSRKIISENVHHLVFSDFPVIYNIHSPMSVSMRSLLEKNGYDPNSTGTKSVDFSNNVIEEFVDIIKKSAPAFKLYTRYFAQMKNMLKALKKEQEQNEEFRKFLQEAQSTLKKQHAVRQTLTSYLQHILQHLSRYPLVLQRVLDSCPEDAPYRDKLSQLNETIKATLRYCNQRKMDEDMQELIYSLEKELNMNLQKRGRRLIKHGKITRTKPTKRYDVHLYIFNDLIIMKDLRRGISHRPPKTIKMHHNVRIGRLSDTSFFIFDCWYQRNQALTLFFECDGEKTADEWVNVCETVMKNRKRLLKQKIKDRNSMEKDS